MTSWDPPLETGFSEGDRYLPEEVERVGTTPTEARQPGVYVLRCSLPEERSLTDLRARWRRFSEHVPPYLEQVPHASELYYVGASNDVYGRIDDHLAGDVRTVTFCKAFPPHHVDGIQYLDDPWSRESGIATTLQNARTDAYVHSR